MRTEAEFALALRQQELLARSARLRGEIAAQGRVLQAPLAAADLARSAGEWIHAHRGWVAVGVAFVFLLRPRRVWRLVRFAWWTSRLAMKARTWLMLAAALAARR